MADQHPAKRQRTEPAADVLATTISYNPVMQEHNPGTVAYGQYMSGHGQPMPAYDATTTSTQNSSVSSRHVPDYPSRPDFHTFRQWIDTLPIKDEKEYLAAAAVEYPAIGSIVQNFAHKVWRRENERVVSFDHYSKTAWRLLNRTYRSSSREYEAAFEVESEISRMFTDMLANTHGHSSFETKLSCVETMRKIFKSTLMSDGQIPHEVRNNACGWDDDFLAALAKFNPEEKEWLVWSADDGNWLGKLEEIVNMTDSDLYFEDLRLGLDELMRIKNQTTDSSSEDKYEEAEENEEVPESGATIALGHDDN